MMAREHAVAVGVLALAMGCLWLQVGKDGAGPAGPVRTKADAVQRSESDVRKTWDTFPRSDVAAHAGEAFLSREECREQAEAARGTVSPSLREEKTRRALQEWAMQDAGEAMEWAAGLADAHESRIAMQQICACLADEDPAMAIRLAWDHGLDEGPGDLVAGLTARWAARDLRGARDWVESQPEGETRDGLMAHVAFELAKNDPPAAARMVAERMGNGEQRMEATLSVLHQWAARDPRAAALWVDAFPAGDLKERAVRELGPQDTR